MCVTSASTTAADPTIEMQGDAFGRHHDRMIGRGCERTPRLPVITIVVTPRALREEQLRAERETSATNDDDENVAVVPILASITLSARRQNTEIPRKPTCRNKRRSSPPTIRRTVAQTKMRRAFVILSAIASTSAAGDPHTRERCCQVNVGIGTDGSRGPSVVEGSRGASRPAPCR